MLRFFTWAVDSKAHADLVQTWLAVFLRLHQTEVSGIGSEAEGGAGGGGAEAKELLRGLQDSQEALWGKVDAQFNKCLCFLKVLTQTQSQW